MNCPECNEKFKYYLKFVVHMIREHNWNEKTASEYWWNNK